jgi:copper chaperone CopZ
VQRIVRCGAEPPRGARVAGRIRTRIVTPTDNSIFYAMNTRLKIAKLTDASDTAHIEKALEAVPRVTSVRVQPSENQAIVEHDGADERELTASVKQLGYVAMVE